MSDPDDDDEEALTWAGARDPSLYETPEPKVAKPPAPKRRAAGTAKSAAGTDGGAEAAGGGHAPGAASDEGGDDEDDEPASMSSAVLVCLGVLGGLFALYTAGWFVSFLKLVYSPSDVLELAAFHVQQVLAILAPPVWFITVMLLTRQRRAATRLLWLVVGAILLVPWLWILER